MSSLNKPVILAVDDMAISLRTVKLALGEGFDVRLAKSGDLGLSIAGSEKIDLILLDIEMPDMSGFEFIQKLKDLCPVDRPPVIFVTSHVTSELLARAKAAGAAGYVLKPADPEVLRKKVLETLKKLPAESACSDAGGEAGV